MLARAYDESRGYLAARFNQGVRMVRLEVDEGKTAAFWLEHDRILGAIDGQPETRTDLGHHPLY